VPAVLVVAAALVDEAADAEAREPETQVLRVLRVLPVLQVLQAVVATRRRRQPVVVRDKRAARSRPRISRTPKACRRPAMRRAA
jgi:hypothetical protein